MHAELLNFSLPKSKKLGILSGKQKFAIFVVILKIYAAKVNQKSLK